MSLYRLRVHVYVYVYVFRCVSINLSVGPSLCVFVDLFMYECMYVSMYLGGVHQFMRGVSSWCNG